MRVHLYDPIGSVRVRSEFLDPDPDPGRVSIRVRVRVDPTLDQPYSVWPAS